MKKTINLYHWSLIPEKERLPLSNVLFITGGVLTIMVSAVILLNLVLNSKQYELAQKTASVKVTESEIKTLNTALETKRDTKNLQKELDRVNSKIDSRKQLLAYLESGELSFDATRYGEVMDDLANYHNPNLWLTDIEINIQRIRLAGQTVTPSVIPQWLKALQQSPFFEGKTFSSVKFDEVDGNENVKEFFISTDFVGEADESISTTL